MRLKSITFDSTDEQLVIETTEVKAKSFTGAERKFKGRDVVAMVKIDDEKFLVAGSLYRGKANLYTFAHWSGHLNGVGIYRNGHMLKVLFKYAKALIEKETELTENAFLSFDVAMHQLRCTLSGQKHFNNRSLPENHLLDCPIISNYSLPIDADTTIYSVKKEYPQTIILHKK